MIFVILFFGLSLSIGVKLGLVFRDRYPTFSRTLLLAAVAQAVLVLIPAWRAPELIILMVTLVLVGFGGACLFDRLKPKRITPKRR